MFLNTAIIVIQSVGLSSFLSMHDAMLMDEDGFAWLLTTFLSALCPAIFTFRWHIL